jgi:hypothetical protein
MEDDIHKWLGRLHGLRAELVEIRCSPVDLEEDTRETDREIGVRTFSAVRPSRSVSNVRLVIRGVEVLSVPAAGEVDLRTNAGGAVLLWHTGVLGGLAIKVKAKEVNSSLGGAVGIIAPLGGASAEHAEVGGECRGCSSLVWEEVVDNGASIDAGEAAVSPLEIKVREPVVGLVLLDRDRATLATPQQFRRGLRTKVATPDHRVHMARDSARVHDGIQSLSCNETCTHQPVCVDSRGHRQRQGGGQSFGCSDHCSRN